MKKVKGIVIHCSDSSFGNAQTIEDWHKERGWSDIGYHAVICNGYVKKNKYLEYMDGSIEYGRDNNINGAHAKGFNDYFGLCLIGVDKFTPKQFDSLVKVVTQVMNDNDLTINNVLGHYECRSSKTCPNFDVEYFRMGFTMFSSLLDTEFNKKEK